ncbi:MAG: hypothetical protein PHF51_04565 [Candidatus ainarchaeum sp.]|nr:hypothetical protein [Candidatus ainarchaeum sp.]
MGKRGVIKALAMGVIPLVHAYLFYCWCNEAKVKWGEAWLNSTLYALLFLLPVAQAYPAYRLFSLVDANFRREGKPSYPFQPLHFSLLFIIPPIAVFAWIYAVYQTQLLFNENGVPTLA